MTLDSNWNAVYHSWSNHLIAWLGPEVTTSSRKRTRLIGMTHVNLCRIYSTLIAYTLTEYYETSAIVSLRGIYIYIACELSACIPIANALISICRCYIEMAPNVVLHDAFSTSQTHKQTSIPRSCSCTQIMTFLWDLNWKRNTNSCSI